MGAGAGSGRRARCHTMRVVRRPRIALTALVMATSLTVVATSAPAPAGELVLPPTTTAAERIVDDYNAKNTLNNATLSIEGQAAIETPPIKTIDDAVFREHMGRGETTLGDPFTVDEVEVFVPDQSSYPLVFLALETLTSPELLDESTTQLLVFTQSGADEPWKVTLAASLLPDVETPRVATDEHGLATLVTGKDAASLQVHPRKLATKLARLWQRSAGGAAISKPFAPGLLTTQAVALFLGELEQLPVNEASVDFTFEPSESQPLCVAAPGSGALCFFVVSYRAVLDPVSGVFVQPPTREALTGLVVPGEYGSVTFDRIAIVLAEVPERSGLGRVDVIGVYNGLISAETSPRGVGAPDNAV